MCMCRLTPLQEKTASLVVVKSVFPRRFPAPPLSKSTHAAIAAVAAGASHVSTVTTGPLRHLRRFIRFRPRYRHFRHLLSLLFIRDSNPPSPEGEEAQLDHRVAGPEHQKYVGRRIAKEFEGFGVFKGEILSVR